MKQKKSGKDQKSHENICGNGVKPEEHSVMETSGISLFHLFIIILFYYIID